MVRQAGLAQRKRLRAGAAPLGAGVGGHRLVAGPATVAGKLSTNGRGRPTQTRRDHLVQLTGRYIDVDLAPTG